MQTDHATISDYDSIVRAGFKGGQTGQLPRASTKTLKKLLPKETYFLKLIIWNKKYDVSLFI